MNPRPWKPRQSPLPSKLNPGKARAKSQMEAAIVTVTGVVVDRVVNKMPEEAVVPLMEEIVKCLRVSHDNAALEIRTKPRTF